MGETGPVFDNLDERWIMLTNNENGRKWCLIGHLDSDSAHKCDQWYSISVVDTALKNGVKFVHRIVEEE
jgi:hypothetical protein